MTTEDGAIRVETVHQSIQFGSGVIYQSPYKVKGMQEIDKTRGYLEIIPDVLNVSFIKTKLLVCLPVIVEFHTMPHTPPVGYDVVWRWTLLEEMQHCTLDKFRNVAVGV